MPDSYEFLKAHKDRIEAAQATDWQRRALAAEAKVAALQAERAQWQQMRTALEGLVGASTREELEQMEVFMRIIDAPAADKAASINAIHALLAALTAQQERPK